MRILGQALDALEDLARRFPLAPPTGEFLALLEDEVKLGYDPAWEPTDAIWVAAGLREARGERELAASLVLKLAFRVLSEGRFGAAAEAAELADRAAALGADVGQLRAQLEDKPAPAENPHTGIRRAVRIAVIGGDERLAGMEISIRNQVSGVDPAIELEFHPTDWSSNWGRQFDRLKPGLGRLDAIVVLRLIRTQLGRELRRSHACWVGCAGDSPACIGNAVLLAASRARPPAPQARGAAAAGGTIPRGAAAERGGSDSSGRPRRR